MSALMGFNSPSSLNIFSTHALVSELTEIAAPPSRDANEPLIHALALNFLFFFMLMRMLTLIMLAILVSLSLTPIKSDVTSRSDREEPTKALYVEPRREHMPPCWKPRRERHRKSIKFSQFCGD